MTNCTYRATTECNADRYGPDMSYCKLCLMGMLCDEVGLNTSAIMSLSMDKIMEAVHKEEYE